MRSFEERKAEIFSRSEVRIKENKQRKKKYAILSASLIIFIAVFSSTALPVLMSLRAKSLPDNCIVNEETNSTSDVIVGATLQSSNHFQLYTEQDVISDMKNIIDEVINYNSVYTETTTSQFYTSNEEEEIINGEKDNETYTITFEDSLGNKTLYTLENNVLYDSNSNKETVLTDDQLKRVKLVFKLENEKRE